MTKPPRSARAVNCPVCAKPSLFAPSNPWRPFCCERCKLMDLGAWAAEEYRIREKPQEGGETDDPDQTGAS